MARSSDIPEFGNLTGMKIVVSAASTGGPFAGSLFAENGADVILLEPPKGIDPLRWSFGGWGVENERRNMRSIVLDIRQPEGREIILKLAAWADAFIEASRGGQWSDWGYPDEVLWEANPRLIIAHMSGFGEWGDPDYVKRPGYDHTVQAFSGTMMLTGFPDRDPVLSMKFVSDYYAGLFAYGSVLAAYIKRMQTGEGESIELAQYELAVRCLGPSATKFFQEREQESRPGSTHPYMNGCGYYTCRDGRGIYTLFQGEGVLRRLIPYLGLEYGSELFPEGITRCLRGTPTGDAFEEAIQHFFDEHDAAEAEKLMMDISCPCGCVLGFAEMETNPHYLARNTFIEWENIKGETIKGIAPVPRYKKHPQAIWRPCPTIGMDIDDVLADLGITDSDYIAKLYEKKVIQKKDILRG